MLAIILLSTISLGVAQDSVPVFKDQKRSSTKWGEVNIDSFLSLKEWKDQSDERSQVPKWETIVRERSNREIMGHFFQCVGTCRIDRGESFFNPDYRAAIYEGDELQTFGESYAWIFLFDGTMIRLSPESSINFNEINIGVKENFLNVRVNAGNILWLSRNEALFEENNIRETDVLFLPQLVYEALPVPDRKNYIEDNLIEMLEEKQTVLNQYKNLNKLVTENNKQSQGKRTYAFITTPTVTLMGYSPSLEIVSLLGGKTYLKKRSLKFLGLKSDEAEEDIFSQMRGYENTELSAIESDKWLVVDEKGRSLIEAEEHLDWLIMGEFITKHIPSLMVGRELMFSTYSEFAFREKYDPKALAENEGYRLWGLLKSDKKDDLELRLDFLKEYFRRVETTNLLVSARFKERLGERGETIKSMEYGNYFFIKAINKYYSYEEYSDDNETGEILNSTTKAIWKRMHGIK